MFTSIAKIIPTKQVYSHVYSQIILFGLNYSFKRIRGRKIVLNMQYAYNYTLRLPRSFVGRIYKRRFVLFGEKLTLRRFIKELVKIRKPNIYTGKGLRLRTIPYHVKPGKIRKR